LNKKELLEIWLDKYTQRLVRLAFSYTKDWLKAEDYVQDAFIKAFVSMDQLENKRDPFPWLARIVINECKISFRKSLREVLFEFLPEINQESAEDIYLQNIVEDDVHNAVHSLPKHYSLPITLYYFEDLSIKQIAEILNLNVGTIKSRLARGRKLLRKKVKGDEYGRKSIKIGKNVL
jgi:RNA polymerase sigma-70 factor, ECF subfamily